MINKLKNLWQYLVHRWKQILIGLGVLTIVTGVIARLLTPSVSEVLTPQLPISEPLARPVQVHFTGDRSMPGQLRLYQASSIVTPERLATTLARNIELFPHGEIPGFFTNAENTITLTQPAGGMIVEYSQDGLVSNQPIDLETVQALGLAFLEQIGYPADDMELDTSSIVYLELPEGDIHFEETDAQSAQLIELAFTRNLGGYPTALSSSPLNRVLLTVSADGVVKATLTSLLFETQARGSSALMDIDEILDEVRAGNYLILGQIDVIDPRDPESGLVSMNLSSKQIEYRLDPRQQLFIPFVSFAGTVTIERGETMPIVITTPAIRTVPALQ